MNKIIKLVLITLCFSASAKITRSQIQFFDSVKTVVSSSTYDYKNPVFSNDNNGYFSEFYWLFYERHNGNSSDIIVRKARYSSFEDEIVITNTSNTLNINPSYNRGMLVWQSNVRGNWDLYYSVLSGSNWSTPALIDSSYSDETYPSVKNNNLSQNFYYLAFKRNNSIGFKRFITSSGIWDNDTLVTEGINEDITPIIMDGNFSNQSVIYFLRKYTGGMTRLNQKVFYDNYNGGKVTWENTFEIYQPNPQNNLSISYSFSEFLTYSYDTLGSKHILISSLNGQNAKGIVTKNIPGKHIRGKGTLMPIITDEITYYFSAFSSLSRSSDSLLFTFINRAGSGNNNPLYKRVYIGDTSAVVRFDVSQPIFQQSWFFYRIKTIWEKTSGGRTSLVESYLTDLINDIANNNSIANGFYLKQNYPNPFNPVTNLEFGISDLGFVSLKIYDLLGKEVTTLVNEVLTPGTYKYTFNASDLSSGIYYYKLSVNGFTDTKRLTVVK